MAVVQYTAIVNQIRGKLNGSVFNKSRNAYTLQRKQQPPKKMSAFQSVNRANFSRVQRAWKTLTSSQQEMFALNGRNNPVRDRFGQQTILSGYNVFVKYNTIRLLTGEQIANELFTSSAFPLNASWGNGALIIDVFPNGQTQINGSVLIDVVDTNQDVLVFMFYASQPISNGITTYSGRWYYCGYTLVLTGGLLVGENEIETDIVHPIDYPAPVGLDQRVLMRVAVWAVQKGAKIADVEINAELI